MDTTFQLSGLPSERFDVRLLDALEAFKREQYAFHIQAQEAPPQDIARLERPMNAAAVAVADLLVKAQQANATLSFGEVNHD